MTPWKASLTLPTGLAAGCLAMLLVLILSAHPLGARLGTLLAGLCLAVPSFLGEPPLSRVLLLGLMAAPFAAAAALVLAPALPGLRARLAYLFTYGNTHAVQRRGRSFDAAAFLQLAVATAVLAVAVAAVKAASAYGLGLPVRWLAGGIAVLALAEMLTASLPVVAAPLGLLVPPLFQSPYRSASIREFWSRRWNLRVSEFLFHKCCFAPLARRSLALALFAPFALSGVLHACLAYVALGRWPISLCCGTFFVVQPLLIALERILAVRRWGLVARRAWTLAALTITSPLFVEPVLRVVEPDWGGPEQVLAPAVAVLCYALVVSSIVALGSLAARPPPVSGPAVAPSANL